MVSLLERRSSFQRVIIGGFITRDRVHDTNRASAAYRETFFISCAPLFVSYMTWFICLSRWLKFPWIPCIPSQFGVRLVSMHYLTISIHLLLLLLALLTVVFD